MHSQFDEIAKRVVAAGGGTQAVTDATDLRTPKRSSEKRRTNSLFSATPMAHLLKSRGGRRL